MNLRPPGYEPDELPDCSTPRRKILCSNSIPQFMAFVNIKISNKVRQKARISGKSDSIFIFRFQTLFPLLPIRHKPCQKCIKRGAVVGVDEVQKFMQNDLLNAAFVSLHQLEVQADTAARRCAAPPYAAHIAYFYDRKRHRIRLGKGINARKNFVEFWRRLCFEPGKIGLPQFCLLGKEGNHMQSVPLKSKVWRTLFQRKLTGLSKKINRFAGEKRAVRQVAFQLFHFRKMCDNPKRF